MPCTRVDLGNGSVALVKHGKPRAPKCRYCRKMSTKLCDAIVGQTLGGSDITCDAPICDDHATSRGGASDFCPKH